jgi:hypothetical protein
VSCRRPAACQHMRKSVCIVSRCRPVVGCRIKQEIKSMVLRHSPVVQQRDPTSKQHTRKSDLTVSCRRPAACQVWTVSCHRPAAGCRIKQEIKSTVLRHSPVVQQHDPTSKQHTRKSDLTVSCRRPVVCQHTRKSVWTVSCRRPAGGCRIKQEIESQPANCTQEYQP